MEYTLDGQLFYSYIAFLILNVVKEHDEERDGSVVEL